MIDDFPLEIIDLIVNNLQQPELVALNLVNQRFHHLITPRLFRSIEINSRKSFTEEPDSTSSLDLQRQQHQQGHGYDYNCIKITSIYNLKCFLKKLIQQPYYCSLIHHLVFKNLPDLPEDFLIHYFNHIFPNLVNLLEFRWYSTYNLDLSIINSIPTSKLLVLNGNFKNFEKFSGDFLQLKSLSLSDFKNFDNIRINLSQFRQLKSLKISKKNLIIVEDPISHLLINPVRLNLVALNLTNLYLTPSDVDNLLSKINFPTLRYLRLVNCYEFFDNNNPAGANLLNRLSELELQHLTKVELNVSNNDCYNGYIYKFLASLPSLTTCKILLNVNNDVSKCLPQLIQHLNPQKLQSLEINYKSKNGQHSHTQLLNVHNFTEFVHRLNMFAHLNHLQFPVLSRNLSHLTLNLPRLCSLQLNFVDVLKVNNSLINFEVVSDLSNDYFPYILKKLTCEGLRHIIIKLDKLYIYEVGRRMRHTLPI